MGPNYLIIVLSTLYGFVQGLTYNGRRVDGVNGTRLAAGTLKDCVSLCDTYPSQCFSVDYHKPTTACILYARDAACSRHLSVAADWQHYRRLACRASYNDTEEFSCTGNVYFEAGTLGSGTGGRLRLSTTPVTLLECLNSCMTTPTCFGVDYNLVTGVCSYTPREDNTYNRIQLDSTRHYTKLCNVSARASASSTEGPTSTQPPVVADPVLAELIGNDGTCPAHFQRFERYQLGAGTVEPGVADLFSCRVACYLDSLCQAYDWNKVTSECLLHQTINLANFQSAPCCDHYRKNNCKDSTCYFQNSVETTLFSGIDYNNILVPVHIPDLSIETCPQGLCLTEYTLDTTKVQPVETVRRRCESVESGPLRECSVTNAEPDVFTYKCVCRGDRCNSFAYLHYKALFAYLPLDGSAEDFSAYHRSPDPSNVVNMDYDMVDRKKNAAGFFDGTAFIQINSFGLVTLGEVANTGSSSAAARAGLTVALWLKRTDPVGEQVIMSNGLGQEAPVVIRSEAVDTYTHNIAAKVGLRAPDGTVLYFNTNTTAPMNEWVFLVVQVYYDIITNSVSMSIYVTDDQLGAAADIDTQPMGSGKLPVKMTISPMCFGKQFALEPNQVLLTEANHFKGLMDEIRVFVYGSVSRNALQAMIDETKPI